MIPFDLIYCRPNTLEEAFQAFVQLESQGKNPVYYAGGSEIITMSRAGSIQPGAVIDLKQIPECKALALDSTGLCLGSICTLNEIKQSKLFPLLGLACGRIADHTNQCRITLGGNLCGTIRYRETCLPLLVSDATITLFGKQGLRTLPFASVFDGRMQHSPGEFIVQIHVPKEALQAPHYHIKQTANEKIDYPLVSIAALWQNHSLRVACSGLCLDPFRSVEMEAVFNDRTLSCADRADKAVQLLPQPAFGDVEGSAEYRKFVFRNIMQTLLEEVAHGPL
ncbi:MAG: FAD binding domain-containing protein [Oscillospiraceae bacterium]